MTPRAIVSAALLVVGTGVELVCCIGVLVMRSVYDKLHYTAPATTVGSLAISAAIVVQESFSQAGIKATLVFLVLLVTNPVLTHATARAARVRDLGGWDAAGAPQHGERRAAPRAHGEPGGEGRG